MAKDDQKPNPNQSGGGQPHQERSTGQRDTFKPSIGIPGPFPTTQKDKFLAQAAARAASRHSTPPFGAGPAGPSAVPQQSFTGFGTPSTPPGGAPSPFPPSAPPGPQGFGAPSAAGRAFGGPSAFPPSAPPAQQGFGAPPAQQGFGASPAQQGFGASPAQQGFGAPPAQQGFGGSPAQQGFGGSPAQQGYAPPSSEMGFGAQQPNAQYAPPPAEYSGQGPSGRSLTPRGQLRQQMFSSTPSGLTNSGAGAQDQGGGGGGYLGQEAPSPLNAQSQGTSSPFGGKPSTPMSPFGAQSTGASTPPFGAQPPGAGTTPPFGAQPPGAGTTPPFGAQPGGTAPPFGARPPGAGTTPPFGAQPGGTAPLFGARPPGAGTTPPFGAQPGGTAPPFGARPPGTGITPPFAGSPPNTGAPPSFGAPSTAVAHTPNFASPPQSGVNLPPHGAPSGSANASFGQANAPFGDSHPTAQGGSGPFGGSGVPFTNAPSKGFAGPRGQRTLGEPQGLSNSPGINLPSGFTGPPGAMPHPQAQGQGQGQGQGQMQMQGEGQEQAAFPTFGGMPIPAGELDAEDQPNYHRLQRGPGEEGRFYEEGYEPPDLPDLTLTQDPRLWAPIDVPTTPRAKQKAYRTLETSRQLNQDLAQPSLRKTNFHGDHYDPIDPDELDPIKGALQQRNVRRRHNAPEEYENELFAWSVSGWSIAHTEDRLRSD